VHCPWLCKQQNAHTCRDLHIGTWAQKHLTEATRKKRDTIMCVVGQTCPISIGEHERNVTILLEYKRSIHTPALFSRYKNNNELTSPSMNYDQWMTKAFSLMRNSPSLMFGLIFKEVFMSVSTHFFSLLSFLQPWSIHLCLQEILHFSKKTCIKKSPCKELFQTLNIFSHVAPVTLVRVSH